VEPRSVLGGCEGFGEGCLDLVVSFWLGGWAWFGGIGRRSWVLWVVDVEIRGQEGMV
jgi:hypothetical protein